MSLEFKSAIAVFLNLSLLVNQLSAELQQITFDSAEWIPLRTVGANSGSGWWLDSGNAIVSPDGAGFGGGQALRIPANSAVETKITRSIAWDTAATTAFIDFQVKPAADPVGSLASIHANGTQIAFQAPQGSNAGEVWIYQGNDGVPNSETQPEEWIRTVGSFPVATGATMAGNYLRVTFRHDYQRNLWDLFIDGKLSAANLSFEGRGANLQSIDFYGSRIGDTDVDNLAALTNNMLFPDADRDGLPDAWETSHGSNPNVYDRDNLNPATGFPFLDDYMDSLWPTGGANGSAGLPSSGGIPLLTIDSEAPHQAVGALKGSLSVGGDGSAAYSIPIDLPKGTGGMEPKLSLAYSSGSGNGMVGLGFDLSGLQAITRGPTSKTHDGFADGMDFDSNDRFYFNGERLVCVNGSYGADGAEYRTQTDSFARIRSFGSYFGGPARWEVETKAGLRLYFGTAPGNHGANALDSLAWRVCRVEDTVGNYYTCSYNQETLDARVSPSVSSISSYPSEIRYSGNANKGLLPYEVVRFAWQDRPDRSSGMAAGIRYHNNMRLKTIGVFHDPSGVSTGTRIHEYQLTYQDEESGFGSWPEYQDRSILPVSKLASVSKIVESGASIPATIIGWTGDSAQIAEMPAAPGFVGNSTDQFDRDMGRFKYGDFNGDGITDVCYINGYGSSAACSIYLYQKNGGYVTGAGPSLYVTGNTDGVKRDTQRVVLADFNGDGKTDIYRIEGYGGAAAGSLFLSRGDGTFSARINGPILNVGSTTDTFRRDMLRFKYGDFNGDGVTDICYVNGFGASVACSIFLFQRDGSFVSGAGPVLPVTGNTDGCIRDMQRVVLADFNGDGNTDINRIDSWGNALQCSLYLASCDGGFGARIPGPALWIGATTDQFDRDMSRVKYSDFNGDGITDICYINGYGTTEPCAIYCYQSDGSFVQSAGPALKVTGDTAGVLRDTQRVVLADFNGDGNTDIYRIEAYGNANPGSLYLSTGDGRFKSRIDGPGVTVGSTTDTFRRDMLRFKFGDVNGDGTADLCYVNGFGTSEASSVFLFQRDESFIYQKGPVLPVTGNTDGCIRDMKRVVLADFNGDGRSDVLRIDGWGGSACRIWQHQSEAPLVTTITDGFGSDLQIEYHSLNDPSPTPGFGSPVYGKCQDDLPAGQVAVMNGRFVVSAYSEPDGNGGRRYRSQRYGDLRYDRDRESSLGFGWIEAKDELNNQTTRTETSRVYPFGGSPVLTRTWVEVKAGDLSPVLPGVTEGMKCLSEETATYAEMPTQTGTEGVVIHRPVQIQSQKCLYDLAGNLISRNTTIQNPADFDAYGFVTHSTSTSLDGTMVATTSAFTHTVDANRWHLGRLSQAVVSKSGGNAPSLTKTSAFTYDSTNGLLKTETVEPGHALSVTKTYTHDGFGNVIASSVTGSGLTRSSTSVYDSQGRFVLAESNQLGHTVSYNYDAQRALLLSTTDIAGKTTAFGYDAFGTVIRTWHPDGTQTGESTGFADGSLLPASVTALVTNPIRYYRAKQSSGSPVGKVYLDALGREIVAESTILHDAAASGSARYSKIYTVSQYDVLGRKTLSYEPFGAGDTPLVTRIRYDLLGRVAETIHPDGQSDSVVEFSTGVSATNPLTYSKVKNARNGVLERWENQHGRLIQSRDPSGQITVFNHDQEGRILSVAINGATLLTNTFDLFGNKIQVNEVNSGTSSSVYNALGEVTSTTNAKGQVTSFACDILGRATTVARPEGTYTTAYDGARGSGLGKPWKTTGPDGYQETVSYDNFGRARSTTTTRFNESFTTSSNYDALGRPLTETDAGGLTVVHEYDPYYSFPTALRIGPGSEGAGTLLWQAGTFDSKGRAITQTLAQGVSASASYHVATGLLATMNATQGGTTLQAKSYEWDSLGNITARNDIITARGETFSYDTLNRVTGSTVATLPGSTISTVPPPAAYAYATNGNLLSKPGLSNAVYGGPRPHAVTSATVKGVARSYAYDAAGYVTADGKRTYNWTSFGQLSSLDYLSAPALQTFSGVTVYQASRVQSDFSFDAGGNRTKQLKQRIAADDSRQLEETLYLGSYEREIHMTKASAAASPVVTKTVHRHNLGGFAVYTKTAGTTGSSVKLSTILKDHLGSTDLILTSAWNGSTFANPQSERQSFDSWGERRATDTLVTYRATDIDPFRTSAQDYDRGYTGHEQLDDSGLIHMNGRIYDPELGRMLSPDPVVQVPEYSQNFNRYSYVMNNPLNLTDPTGFSWLSKAFHKVGSWIKENWRTVVSIVVGALLIWTGIGASMFWGLHGLTGAAVVGTHAAVVYGGIGAITGSIMGGLSAALAGGDLGDVLRGATVGAIQGAISGGVLHGMGVAADKAGFFSQETALHVAGHGVVGGAANAAMGGKFQDGFLSAAVSAGASDAGLLGDPNADGPGAVASRTIKAGIVGGTASALGGGKFANGAYTAAFQHLLNFEIADTPRAIGSVFALIGNFISSIFSSISSGVSGFFGSAATADRNANTPWMTLAEGEIGIHEDSNPSRVREYHATTWQKLTSVGENGPWCSSFVNWVMGQAGIHGTNSAGSQCWLGWGQSLSSPAYGAIAISSNGGGRGHVGFISGRDNTGRIVMLGGNQSNSVRLSPNRSSLQFRFPSGYVPNYNLPVMNVTGPNLSYSGTR